MSSVSAGSISFLPVQHRTYSLGTGQGSPDSSDAAPIALCDIYAVDFITAMIEIPVSCTLNRPPEEIKLLQDGAERDEKCAGRSASEKGLQTH